MMLPTITGIEIDSALLRNYLKALINLFFKILPLWEDGESSLVTYMKSLQAELLGCSKLILAVNSDAAFLSLLSILQYLIDHPELEARFVKREVFRAISICNKLKARYAEAEDEVSNE